MEYAAGEQEYLWTVPDDTTEQGRVKVVWFRTLWSSYSDESDSDFTIMRFVLLPPLILFPPEAPSDLVAAGVSISSIRLKWTDNSSWETGFKIERWSVDLGWIEIATVGCNVTEYLDGGLHIGTDYSYRVRAYNSRGNSNYSNGATAFTWSEVPSLTPPAPTGLTAVPVSLTAIDLEWEDTSDNETGFRIERRSDGSFAQIAVVGANVTEYVNSGLMPGTTYEYRVQAFNSVGDSSFSSIASATTLSPTEPVQIRLLIDQRGYYVNDVVKMMDTTPIIRHGRTLLPIKYVAENIGAAVSWDPVEKKAMIVRGATVVELWLNQNQARVNGTMVLIDPLNPSVVPISIPPGRTMLPIRFVGEALNCAVQWEPLTQQVTVTYPQP